MILVTQLKLSHLISFNTSVVHEEFVQKVEVIKKYLQIVEDTLLDDKTLCTAV